MGKVLKNAGYWLTAYSLAAVMVLLAIALRLTIIGVIIGFIVYVVVLMLRALGAM